jgi:hypothetical protein
VLAEKLKRMAGNADSDRLCHATQLSQIGSILFLSYNTFRCCTT